MIPASVSDWRTNLAGLVSMLGVTAWVVAEGVPNAIAIPLLMVAAAVPVLAADVFVHRVHLRPSTGLDWWSARERDWTRIATKWFGAGAVLAAIGAGYFLIREYRDELYEPFWSFLVWTTPGLVVFGAAYFAWLDRYLVEPRDAYWHLGAWLLGNRAEVDRAKVEDLLRVWLVKAFFVPLMFVFAGHNVDGVRRAVAATGDDFAWWYRALFELSFAVDVIFTTMGYLVTLRVFDTHVRSAEPTLKGWVVALMCYVPFWNLVGSQYLVYFHGMGWKDWLADWPTAKVAWGCGLLFWSWMFCLSTVNFGCRFSNLTNRGVLTNGFYAWTKHPAYVAKLASFGMMAVPFVWDNTLEEVVRDCLLWATLAGVYFLRAKTEEEHLGRKDPAYVQYGLAMNERSVFAFLGRWIPALKYRPPADA